MQVGLSAEVEVEARFQLAGQAHPLIRFLALLLGSGITAEGHLCLAWPPGRRMAVTDHSRCWPIPVPRLLPLITSFKSGRCWEGRGLGQAGDRVLGAV